MRDPAAFDAFYSGSVQRVTGQLYAMTGSRAEAEDCVQEAYARAWQRWDKVSGYGDPEAWVRTVAYRVSVSAWRKAANMRVAHRRQWAPGRRARAEPGLRGDHRRAAQDTAPPAPGDRPVPPGRAVGGGDRQGDRGRHRHGEGPAVPRPPGDGPVPGGQRSRRGRGRAARRTGRAARANGKEVACDAEEFSASLRAGSADFAATVTPGRAGGDPGSRQPAPPPPGARRRRARVRHRRGRRGHRLRQPRPIRA